MAYLDAAWFKRTVGFDFRRGKVQGGVWTGKEGAVECNRQFARHFCVSDRLHSWRKVTTYARRGRDCGDYSYERFMQRRRNQIPQYAFPPLKVSRPKLVYLEENSYYELVLLFSSTIDIIAVDLSFRMFA